MERRPLILASVALVWKKRSSDNLRWCGVRVLKSNRLKKALKVASLRLVEAEASTTKPVALPFLKQSWMKDSMNLDFPTPGLPVTSVTAVREFLKTSLMYRSNKFFALVLPMKTGGLSERTE